MTKLLVKRRYMTTTINLQINAQLKSEAERAAKRQGTSLSTVLSDATRAFVEDQLVTGIDSNIVEEPARAQNPIDESAWNF